MNLIYSLFDKKKSPDLFCFQRSRSQLLAKFSLSTLIHPHPFSSYFLPILHAASYSHWLQRVWLASPVYLVAPCTSSSLVLVSPSTIQGSASSSKLCAPERNQSCSFFFSSFLSTLHGNLTRGKASINIAY